MNGIPNTTSSAPCARPDMRFTRSAWIKEQQVDIEDGRIIAYRVNMLVTFVLDD